MALNDILLHIDSYPEATPAPLIDAAVSLAGTLGGKVTALATEVTFPLKTNRVADALVGLRNLAKEEAARSRQCAESALAHFRDAATRAGVFEGVVLDTAYLYSAAEHAAIAARTRDLCIVPLAGPMDGQQDVAQTVVFGSGRPVVLIGANAKSPAKTGLGVVVLAWDGSRAAARAMADAMPILVQAKAVQVLTVVNDKPSATAGQGADAVRHLTLHGAAAKAAEIDADGRRIGAVLADYLRAQDADMLVMGGYGHSRLREFILGGATEHMLRDPPLPVFLAH
jgi:nucleotide-binding universal stress UspA family protein